MCVYVELREGSSDIAAVSPPPTIIVIGVVKLDR